MGIRTVGGRYFSGASLLALLVAGAAPDSSADVRAPPPLATFPPLSPRQRQEMDELRRQDLAAELASSGVNVNWQRHSAAELLDWRQRIESARALRVRFNVDLDWKSISLDQLTELRLRASKAAALFAEFGVSVEWTRYSWSDLETLRQQLTRLKVSRHAGAFPRLDGDGLATPWTSPTLLSAPPHRPLDPDALVEPLFGFDAASAALRVRVDTDQSRDPDAIMVPTFAAVSTPRPGDSDDVIDPWSLRSCEPRKPSEPVHRDRPR